MTGYEEVIRQLGDNAEKILIQLWQAVEDGQISVADFPEIAAQILAVANEQGRAAAEVAFSGYMSAATGQVTVPSVAPVVDDTARLTTALQTIVASDQDTLMQLARIATAEPLEAAARRFSESVTTDKRVKGWVRQLEPNACELCVWWWREGRVWPKNHPFPTHKGCTCHPLPTVAGEIPSTMYTRKIERARQAAENTARHNPERIAS